MKDYGDGSAVDARYAAARARWLPRPLVLDPGIPPPLRSELMPAPDAACFAALTAAGAPGLPAAPAGVGDLPTGSAADLVPDSNPAAARFPTPLPAGLDQTDPDLLVRRADRIRLRTDRRTRGLR